MYVTTLKYGEAQNFCKECLVLNSYRPILLLSNISKIFENVIEYRNDDVWKEHYTIPTFLFCFRRHHSSTNTLLKYANDVTDALNSFPDFLNKIVYNYLIIFRCYP